MRRLICLFIALVVPSAAHAQSAADTASAAAPSSAVFAYLQLGDTIAFEAVRSDTAMVRGAYIIPGQIRLSWDQLLTKGAPSSLTIGVFPPNAPAEFRPVSETDFATRDDSIVVTSYANGKTTSDTRPTVAGALPVLGRSMIHLSYLAFYAAQLRMRTVPLYLTSSGKTVNAQVEVFGERVTLLVEGLRIDALWDDGALVEVHVPSQQLVVRRVMLLPQ
ncbi:hypothetical protein [Gemmatimonas phototrophica]|uniref:DUF5666 domain-containing protein n=1 Tax=Gemmatimonas phototrophica TaxID=1379270 RepID=A0A143BNG7_9BACT|nr:hypothetical protein [Gemmatimonas phototrophica]AMW06062.1 hypothetical protein GEMMAAP_17260 [Gemmatimonas phototrophica]